MTRECIVGVHPIKEALVSGACRLERVLVRRGGGNRQHAEIVHLARSADIPVQFVPRETLDRLAGSAKHQGVLGWVTEKRYVSIDDILGRAAAQGAPPFLLLVDGVEDPRNLGSIIRTADGAGVHGVVLVERRAVGMTPTVVKAAAGAVEHMAIARVANLSDAIRTLKAGGLWVYGLSPRAKKRYVDLDYRGPVAVVVGGEGRGIRPLVLKQCDDCVAIPMVGTVAALNVAVAAAVVIYEIVRQQASNLEPRT